MVKVSIIVPVYNVEEYLKQCLDSIVNQTLKEIEIICINDGSTDNSLKILQEYQKIDKRIVIINKKNEGLSASRNIGLEKASGEFIGFVDSDDYLEKNFYEVLYNCAKKYSCDIACANIVRFTKNKKYNKLIYKKQKYSFNPDEKNKLAGIPQNNYVWNKIYNRKKIIEKDVKFPYGRVYEDKFWSIRAVYYTEGLVTTPDTSYFYRKNSKSIVSEKSDKNMNDSIQSEKDLINFAKQKNLKLPKGFKLAYRERHKILGITYMKCFYFYPDIKKYYLFGLIPVFCSTKKKNSLA